MTAAAGDLLAMPVVHAIPSFHFFAHGREYMTVLLPVRCDIPRASKGTIPAPSGVDPDAIMALYTGRCFFFRINTMGDEHLGISLNIA